MGNQMQQALAAARIDQSLEPKMDEQKATKQKAAAQKVAEPQVSKQVMPEETVKVVLETTEKVVPDIKKGGFIAKYKRAWNDSKVILTITFMLLIGLMFNISNYKHYEEALARKDVAIAERDVELKARANEIDRLNDQKISMSDTIVKQKQQILRYESSTICKWLN
jgi:hypothetical protein